MPKTAAVPKLALSRQQEVDAHVQLRAWSIATSVALAVLAAHFQGCLWVGYHVVVVST
jgi:hypothetical protein